MTHVLQMQGAATQGQMQDHRQALYVSQPMWAELREHVYTLNLHIQWNGTADTRKINPTLNHTYTSFW